MKIRIGFLLLAGLVYVPSFSQTTLFTETFESGSAFTLNTGDLGGATGTSGGNAWVVNNAFAGGNIDFYPLCNGWGPIPVSNTLNQPGFVTNGPQSHYMHIVSDDGITAGVTNANYYPSDNACLYGESHFAKMSNDFSTMGYDTVRTNFLWVCSGGTTNYGQVYFSSNQGITWNPLYNTPGDTVLNGSVSWQQKAITSTAMANKTTVRLGFRFVNNPVTFSGSDPAFSVDEILVQGITAGGAASITTAALPAASFCAGASVSVGFTVTGSLNGGNAFTAQLSDASGLFTAPVNIGTSMGTGSGNINCTLPGGATAGTGYRIRVISSSPVVNGSDNGSDITIFATSLGGTATATPDTICPGDSVTITLSGHRGSITWESSPPPGSSFTPAGFSSSSFRVAPASSLSYRASVQNGVCSAGLSNTAKVVVENPVAAFTSVESPPLSVTFTNTSTGAATYAWSFGDGGSSASQDPVHTYASAGTYAVTLIAVSANGCADTLIDSVTTGAVSVSNSITSGFSLWPNPSSGEDIHLSGGNVRILTAEIMDVNGRTLETLHDDAGIQRIPAGRLQPGIYLVRIHSDTGSGTSRICVH